MAECKECGKTLPEDAESDLCSVCARAYTQKPVKLPSAGIVTKEGYEKALKRVTAAPPPPEPEKTNGLVFLALLLLPILWLGGEGFMFYLFGATITFLFWSLCSFFFMIGLTMLVVRRITVRRTEARDSLDPKATQSVPMIVGLFWIFPLLLYVFFFLKNGEFAPREGQLWFVGIMLGIAFVVQIICARAFVPVED
jgi:hypothetical protein